MPVQRKFRTKFTAELKYFGLLWAFLSIAVCTQAQHTHEVIPGIHRSQDAGFQPYNFENTDPLSPEMRASIRTQLNKNKELLTSNGKRKRPNPGTKTPLLQLPIRQATGLNDPGFFSISAYVDHNLNYPDLLLDYSCGNITYDQPGGYNHQGTDFYAWPFAWFKMDFNEVEIVAAADGIILYKEDGHYDRNCSMSPATWNAIYIEHADGSETWYGHFKSGSLTNKTVGDSVLAGEYLGITGSSGSSIAPHLHFEVYNGFGMLIDPFTGPCNYLNSVTWWQNQIPYKERGVNLIASHFTIPDFLPCPQTEIPNRCDNFNPGDTIFLAAYLRNFYNEDTITYRVYMPGGGLWSEWQWVNTWPFFTSAWVYYWIKPSSGSPVGTWRFNFDYNGQTYDHYFNYGITGQKDIDYNNEVTVFPNPGPGVFRLQLPETITKDMAVHIYDGRGRKCYDKMLQSDSPVIDVGYLSDGIYYLHALNHEFSYYQKIIINHSYNQKR